MLTGFHQDATSETKSRKSVSFMDADAADVPEDGEVKQTNGTSEKSTAESHSIGIYLP